MYSKNKIGVYKSRRKCGELSADCLFSMHLMLRSSLTEPVYQVLDNQTKLIEPFSLIAEEDASVRLVSRAQLKILAISNGYDFATEIYLHMSQLFFSMTRKTASDRK